MSTQLSLPKSFYKARKDIKLFQFPMSVQVSQEAKTKFYNHYQAYAFLYESAMEYVNKSFLQTGIFDTNMDHWISFITENVLKNNPIYNWILDTNIVSPEVFHSALIETHYYVSQYYLTTSLYGITPKNIRQGPANYTIFNQTPHQLFYQLTPPLTHDNFNHYSYKLHIPDLEIESDIILPSDQADITKNDKSILTHYTVTEDLNNPDILLVILSGTTPINESNKDQPFTIPGVIALAPSDNYSKLTLSDGTIFWRNKNIDDKILKIQILQDKKNKQNNMSSEDIQKIDTAIMIESNKLLSLTSQWYEEIVQHIRQFQYKYIYFESPQYYHYGPNISLDPKKKINLVSWQDFFKKLQILEPETELMILPKSTVTQSLCNNCGYDIRVLPNESTWVCPTCGMIHDKDLNQAINILKFSQIDR